MRRLLLLCALAAVAATVSAAPAGAATNECKGLQVCVPVVGPWVVVPSKRTLPRPQVQFQLSCPKGYVVGGFDAELSDRAIDVAFLGTMGAPVNPGISTSGDAVFVGTYVGGAARLPSFRPHLGCMPTRGGGSRTPTAAVFPPGKPIVRHVRNLMVQPGRSAVTATCAADDRLVDGKSALAFNQDAPPVAALARGVDVVQRLRPAGVTATVRTNRLLRGTGASPVVQVMAVCTGGK